jgi:hypothetical protein
MITANKTSSKLILSSLLGIQKRSCSTRGGLTSNLPLNEVEPRLGSILGCRRVLPELKLDIQYFSIGDIGGVDT